MFSWKKHIMQEHLVPAALTTVCPCEILASEQQPYHARASCTCSPNNMTCVIYSEQKKGAI